MVWGSPMADLRHLAEIVLVGRRTAGSIGQDFELNVARVKAMGYSYEDIRRVEEVVREISRFADKQLQSLEQDEA